VPPSEFAPADSASTLSPLPTKPSATFADAFPLRQAFPDDAAELRSLISLSVRELQKHDYSPDQLAVAIQTVFTLDTQLVADGTFFVIEGPASGTQSRRIIACGGWSARKTLCGGDLHAVRDSAFLNPETDAAKIRAFFIHPDWARRGLGSRLLAHCEQAAQAAGFSRFEMAATLTGVPLYLARGYHVVEQATVPLCGPSAEVRTENISTAVSNLPVVIMARSIVETASSLSASKVITQVPAE
jgi:GNAT superfamily N-acetyltransferase